MNSLDILGYGKRLETVSVPREQAEVHAQMLAEVVAQVATKDDLEAREARLQEWGQLCVKEQIQSLKADMLKWLVTIPIAQTSWLFAALRYMPH
ncbi:hypothetical protein GTP44_12765 [Duganella sp. FT50W]|uniref:DUF1640 domain-containing protein n=1 Tax=Duganella lactea TaxID=2692173 RepID=A0A6L8MPM3_9BURK|nr:hypothetical protein [Duganella lactea]MYM82825.1 hypothetical protein [Duganella lactea]